MGNQNLFTGFPPVSTEAWEAVIKSDLRGADYDKKLIWKSLEGFPVKPYYRAEDLTNKSILNSSPGIFPFLRGNKTTSNDWAVRFSIEVDNPSEANRKALYFLNRGVSSLEFTFNTEFFSKVKPGPQLISELFQGIFLDCIEINFNAGVNSLEFLKLFIEYARTNGYDPEILKGSVSLDPFNNLIKTGNFYLSESDDFALCRDLTLQGLHNIPKFRTIAINSAIFGDSGALISQEIAFALAAGSEYLDLHTQNSLSLDDALKRIHFTFSAGSDYFGEIARLRTFRFLWSKLAEAWKPENTENSIAYIHSQSSNWNQTIYDAHVNLLRNTTSAMAAILGGADSIKVKPFDSVFRNSNEFSERIALNTQLILKEEVWLDKVVDPAAGSYYIENLTQSLIQQSWGIFLEIEKEGGYLSSLKKGLIQGMVETTAKNRITNVSSRKEIILGNNQFPNYSEIATSIIEKQIFNSIPLGQRVIKNLDIQRSSYELEIIRIKSEKHDHRPKVFMLTIGNPIMRLARANFSCNFFACGGFEVIDNIGFDNAETGIEDAIRDKSDIIVVCSSDEEYPEIVPEIYLLLSHKHTDSKNGPILVVAGAPPCMEELKAKGIDHFIHVRSNLVQTLKAYQAELGIMD
jgi:methylmalonyl-CoA mutase